MLDTAIYTLTGNTAKIAAARRRRVPAERLRHGDSGPRRQGPRGRLGRPAPSARCRSTSNRTANHLGVAIDAPPRCGRGRRSRSSSRSPREPEPERGGRAAVTVAAVDEGILQLIDQKTAEPFDFFYRKLALGVDLGYDTFGLLLPEVAPEPAGGGEGAEGLSAVRPHGGDPARPAGRLLVRPGRPSDAAGNARVELQPPGVPGGAAHHGGGDARRPVRLGLAAHPRARAARPPPHLPAHPLLRGDAPGAGDGEERHRPRRQLQVTLQALAAAGAGTGQAPVHVEGTRILPTRRPCRCPPGARRPSTSRSGPRGWRANVRFALTAAGNGETTHASETVGVRPDLPVASLEDAGAIGKARARAAAAAGARRFRPETLRRELRLGSVPLVQFAGKLSRPRPLPLRLPGADGRPRPSRSSTWRTWRRSSTPTCSIRRRGMATRPPTSTPRSPASPRCSSTAAASRSGRARRTCNPWATVYAAHFLVEARRAGQPVPDFLYDGALAYLAGDVKAKGTTGATSSSGLVYSSTSSPAPAAPTWAPWTSCARSRRRT